MRRATAEAGVAHARSRDAAGRNEATVPLELQDAAQLVIDECRTVLPGIQALFGFQLIAVFNTGFASKLSAAEQRTHLVAIVLVALAAALLMTPAATHCRAGASTLSWKFVEFTARLLLWSLLPLGIGTSLELYLIAHLILGAGSAAAAIAAGMLGAFATLWVVVPYTRSLRRMSVGRRPHGDR